MSPVDHAVALIERHIPRENRGAIWLRVRRMVESRGINRHVLYNAERNHRIDEWRNATRARKESLRVTFEPVEEHHARLAPSIPEVFPPDFITRLTEVCDPRERTLFWTLLVDDMQQREVAGVLGLTESRIAQLVHELRAKLWRRVQEVWPGIMEELR